MSSAWYSSGKASLAFFNSDYLIYFYSNYLLFLIYSLICCWVVFKVLLKFTSLSIFYFCWESPLDNIYKWGLTISNPFCNKDSLKLFGFLTKMFANLRVSVLKDSTRQKSFISMSSPNYSSAFFLHSVGERLPDWMLYLIRKTLIILMLFERIAVM